jgi:sterol desaturase/sphingolipid hydroxylase (fatty acid hydroxylase superfamily)
MKTLVFPVAMALAWTAESCWPLRQRTADRFRRWTVNLSMGALGAALVGLLIYPAVLAAAAYAEREGWGLLGRIEAPRGAELALGFLLQDYVLYAWHRLNHVVPFLWRFHSAHHADIDLDASTAARFHFGELMLSVVYRVSEIVVFGLDPFAVALYDAVALGGVIFHHANLRLPEKLDAALAWLVVTPRMHGIHHSVVEQETKSNFATVFSFWDRLHRTARLGLPQITIGLPYYRDARELGLRESLAIPFRPVREWVWPDGTAPARRSGRAGGGDR